MKKIMNFCATVLLLSSATICCAQAPPAAAPAAAPAVAPAAAPAAPPKADKVGMMAPAWQAAAVSGTAKSISSEDFKGKPYALLFINSSCSDCRREMDELLKLKFSDQFTVIIGAVDRNMDRALKVYKDEMNIPYPIISDSKFAVAQGFGLAFTPATVIVGADGKVEYRVAGFTDETIAATTAAFRKHLK
jgi:peroxiredoxin